MERIRVTISTEQNRVRMLATTFRGDILKAVLGPITAAHPRAVSTFLEGLSLWHQRPLSIALYAEKSADSFVDLLYEQLGFGERQLHYAVEVVRARRVHRHLISGLGNFRDLRQIDLFEEVGR
jgi:hypothetical protein